MAKSRAKRTTKRAEVHQHWDADWVLGSDEAQGRESDDAFLARISNGQTHLARGIASATGAASRATRNRLASGTTYDGRPSSLGRRRQDALRPA